MRGVTHTITLLYIHNICPRGLIGQDATFSRWVVRVRVPSGVLSCVAFVACVFRAFSSVGSSNGLLIRGSPVRARQGARSTFFWVCVIHLACEGLGEVVNLNG